MSELFSENRPNIRHLAIESAPHESELPFDFEAEVSDDKWRELVEDFEQVCNKEPVQFSRLIVGSKLRIVNPNRARDIDIDPGLINRVYEISKNELENEANESEIYVPTLQALKLIEPDLCATIKIPDSRWKRALDHLENEFIAQEYTDAFNNALGLAIFCPNRASEISDLLRIRLQANELQSSLKMLRDPRSRSFSWYHEISSTIKIINPEIYAKLLPITEEEWQVIRNDLQEIVNNKDYDQHNTQSSRLYRLANYGFRSKILATPIVKITDNGLEFRSTSPSGSGKVGEDFPVQRGF